MCIILSVVVMSTLAYLLYLMFDEVKHKDRQLRLMGDEIHKLENRINMLTKK